MLNSGRQVLCWTPSSSPEALIFLLFPPPPQLSTIYISVCILGNRSEYGNLGRNDHLLLDFLPSSLFFVKLVSDRLRIITSTANSHKLWGVTLNTRAVVPGQCNKPVQNGHAQLRGKSPITTSTLESRRADLPEAEAVPEEAASCGQRGCETGFCESKLITICWLLAWEELREDTFPYNSTYAK